MLETSFFHAPEAGLVLGATPFPKLQMQRLSARTALGLKQLMWWHLDLASAAEAVGLGQTRLWEPQLSWLASLRAVWLVGRRSSETTTVKLNLRDLHDGMHVLSWNRETASKSILLRSLMTQSSRKAHRISMVHQAKSQRPPQHLPLKTA
jgi:hypothetical protein